MFLQTQPYFSPFEEDKELVCQTDDSDNDGINIDYYEEYNCLDCDTSLGTTPSQCCYDCSKKRWMDSMSSKRQEDDGKEPEPEEEYYDNISTAPMVDDNDDKFKEILNAMEELGQKSREKMEELKAKIIEQNEEITNLKRKKKEEEEPRKIIKRRRTVKHFFY